MGTDAYETAIALALAIASEDGVAVDNLLIDLLELVTEYFVYYP